MHALSERALPLVGTWVAEVCPASHGAQCMNRTVLAIEVWAALGGDRVSRGSLVDPSAASPDEHRFEAGYQEHMPMLAEVAARPGRKAYRPMALDDITRVGGERVERVSHVVQVRRAPPRLHVVL